MLIASGLTWSFVFSMAKIAGGGEFHPLGLTFWQGIGGGLMLLTISTLRGRRVVPRLRYLPFYAVCGLFGTSVPTCLMFFVAPEIGAGMLAIVMALVPLMTYGCSLVLRVDRLAPLRLAGIALGLVAVLMIVLPQAGIEGGSSVFWLVLSLVIPAAYTIENMILALRQPPEIDPFALVGTFQIIGALILLPLIVATGTFMDLGGVWGREHWAAVAMLVLNSLSYTLFLYVLKRTGPVFAAQTAYVITVTGVIWGMLLFGERHGVWVWIALAVMLAGMTLVQERRIVPVPAPVEPPAAQRKS